MREQIKHSRVCKDCDVIFKTYSINSRVTCDRCKEKNLKKGVIKRKLNMVNNEKIL